MAGQTLRTNEPGRGLVTGRRCLHVGKFKVPALRGLPGVDVRLRAADKADLVAFVRAR
jgi:hypothetical protein